MWRRAVCSQLKTLGAAGGKASSSSLPSRFRHADRSFIYPVASSSLFNRYFSAGSNGALKKPVEDVMPIATGHEREELEAELQEEPAVVKSYYDRRVVGCPGGEGEDEHDVVWFWLEKGKPIECPVCSQYFVVSVDACFETSSNMYIDY
ncbi:unnamed protein product [Linum tenue]|uniref:Cytochrome c oxidase subunit Vb n=1 Tax=Linum tenue TaxID=586396 RepID=A0AAV0KKS3_9ROSI|nr:unnamed protein product [Linum tenue]